MLVKCWLNAVLDLFFLSLLCFCLLFGSALVVALDRVDETGDALEGLGAGDKGVAESAVVTEDGAALLDGQMIPVGFKPSGILNVELVFGDLNR